MPRHWKIGVTHVEGSTHGLLHNGGGVLCFLCLRWLARVQRDQPSVHEILRGTDDSDFNWMRIHGVQMKLPDEVYNQLTYLLDQKENMQWEIGDFIVDLWSEVARYTPEDERRKEHAILLKNLAENTGTHTGTLRNLERMSGFYSPERRERWSMLTYYQLRSATSAGEEWEGWCEWAVGEGSFNGRPASGDAIREAIAGKRTEEERYAKLVQRIDKLVQQVIALGFYNGDWMMVATQIQDIGEENETQ